MKLIKTVVSARLDLFFENDDFFKIHPEDLVCVFPFCLAVTLDERGHVVYENFFLIRFLCRNEPFCFKFRADKIDDLFVDIQAR
jgi:hypothetical protein